MFFISHETEVFFASVNAATRNEFINAHLSEMTQREYEFLYNLSKEISRLTSKKTFVPTFEYRVNTIDALEKQRRAMYKEWNLTYHKLEYVISRCKSEELRDEFVAFLIARGRKRTPLYIMSAQRDRVKSSRSSVERSYAMRLHWATADKCQSHAAALAKGFVKLATDSAIFMAQVNDNQEVAEKIVTLCH